MRIDDPLILGEKSRFHIRAPDWQARSEGDILNQRPAGGQDIDRTLLNERMFGGAPNGLTELEVVRPEKRLRKRPGLAPLETR